MVFVVLLLFVVSLSRYFLSKSVNESCLLREHHTAILRKPCLNDDQCGYGWLHRRNLKDAASPCQAHYPQHPKHMGGLRQDECNSSDQDIQLELDWDRLSLNFRRD
ncbi:hypothetical protein BJ742DRAFT_786985 [Cladochytrium replicatum]|nr:hypothetical protein BJ742DRAFT_786985 [Cladochytrium replicatum]